MTGNGKFISLEGIEGVGKSTALKFLSQQLTARQIAYIINREPGGTEISEAIRQILLRHYSENMAVDTELLLMFACRAQNLQQVIKPALQQGKWILSDRFTDASFAYQGYGRGMAENRIEVLAHWVHADLQPDITFLLDAPVTISMARLQNRQAKDRFEIEKIEFFEKVRKGYLQLAAKYPQRYRVISANRPLVQVQQQLVHELDKIIGLETDK